MPHFYPILIQESKAHGKRKNVEQQMYDATVQNLTYYNSYISTGCRLSAQFFEPRELILMRVLDRSIISNSRTTGNIFGIDSVDGSRIWNDLMDALLRDYSRL